MNAWTLAFLAVGAVLALWRLLARRPHKDLRGSNVCITGAALGIGRVQALEFARAGARVILLDVRLAEAQRVCDEIRASVPHAPAPLVRQLDVSDRAAVYAVASELGAVLAPGGVDVLVNNAGVVSGRPFLASPDEHLQRTMNVNALAHFWTVKAWLPGMLARGRGHIVTIASTMGYAGAAGLADYCASKHAAIGFHESLMLELRKDGAPVDTTLVCPYAISTGMFGGISLRMQWLLPHLDEGAVGRRIVQAVQQRELALVLPPVLGWVIPLARLLPLRAAIAMGEYLGARHGMDSFAGRGDDAARLARLERS